MVPQRNLLYIISDDLRADTAPRALYNNSFTVFAQCHCQVPACAPSRLSFLTGRRPDAVHAITLPTRGLANAEQAPTLVDWLNRAHFTTAAVGTIFGAREERRGFSSGWANTSTMQSTAHVALHFLDKLANRDNPFGLFVGFSRPRLLHDVPLHTRDAIQEEAAQRWSDAPFAPAFPSRRAGHPSLAYQDAAWTSDPNETAQIRWSYSKSAAVVDGLLQQLLDGLAQRNLAASTLVAFHADHGLSLGEHGAWGAQTAFDAVTHVPLALRIPWKTNFMAHTSSDGGQPHVSNWHGMRRVVEGAVGLIDVLPTIAAALQLPALKHTPYGSMDGTSLLSRMTREEIVTDEQGHWSPSETELCLATFTQIVRHRMGKFNAMGYSVRTARYRYTRWETPQEGQSPHTSWSAVGTGVLVDSELYDHDPNALGDPEARNLIWDAAGSPPRLRAVLDTVLRSRSSHACHRTADGSLVPNRVVPLGQRIAYVHFPKCGSQFADTLLHYANPALPPDVMGSVPVTMTNYTLRQWFDGIFWEKNGHFGNHYDVTEDVLQKYRGRLFGFFREPNRRAHSMYNYFVGDSKWIDERKYAMQIKGSAVAMLAGQRFGLVCVRKDFGCKPILPKTELAVSRVKEFAFIGLTDEWNLSICLFHAMFGGECYAHEFLNTHPTKACTSCGDDLSKPLGGIVDEADQELFRHAAARFWSDVRLHNVSAERCAAVVCPAARSVFQK